MESSPKRNLMFALGTLFVGLTLVFCLLLIWDIFNQDNKIAVYIYLSDAFFVTGFLFSGVGGLILISSTGFFDIFIYGFRTIGEIFLIPFKYKKHEKYYEFVERRQLFRQQRAKLLRFSDWIILIIGLLFIGVAAFFLIFIYK